MKKTLAVMLTAGFLLSSGLSFAQEGEAEGEKRQALAVLDFKPLGVSASESTFVTEFFRSGLVSSRAVKVVDKANMDRILSEQGFQQTGCTTQECAVQMGKLLNVQNIVTGNFGKLGDMYQITISLVSVETGEIVFSDSASCESSRELQGSASELASRLVSDMTGAAASAPQKRTPAPRPAQPVMPQPRIAQPVMPATPAPSFAVPSKPAQVKLQGKVMKVDGIRVTVSLGAMHGLKKNDKLSIMAIVQEIRSPITGEVVNVRTSPIATIKLIYLEMQASIGTIVSIKPGYRIEVDQLVELPGPAKIRIESEAFLNTDSGDGKGSALQELYTQIDWALSSFRVSAGTIYTGFFATSWQRAPLSYFLFSMNSETFEIGAGMTL